MQENHLSPLFLHWLQLGEDRKDQQVVTREIHTSETVPQNPSRPRGPLVHTVAYSAKMGFFTVLDSFWKIVFVFFEKTPFLLFPESAKILSDTLSHGFYQEIPKNCIETIPGSFGTSLPICFSTGTGRRDSTVLRD